jgi:molecular chaperone GrpE
MANDAEANESTEDNRPEHDGAAAEDGQTELEELERLRQECEQNRENYLRLAAELDNVRKRNVREVENARKYGIERFAADMLPVFDSLEAGLLAENLDVETLLEGQRATLRLLEQAFANAGIEQVDPQGELFDPNLHEAMSMLPVAHAEPDSVVEVVQKGYVVQGRVLRPARVIVAARPEGE